jgi:hypothetical protein
VKYIMFIKGDTRVIIILKEQRAGFDKEVRPPTLRRWLTFLEKVITTIASFIPK